MKKRVLFFACLCMLFSLKLNAQTARLYRGTGENTSSSNPVTEWIYTTSAGGDKITYPSALSTSGSNICAPSLYRVQLNSFTLNYKSSSIGKIVISANSSGATSTRTITGLKVNGADVFSSVTIVSTIAGNGAGLDCGDITITGLSAPIDAANGINVEFNFDGNVRLNTIDVWSIAALPLDFLSFTAKPDALGKTVNLNWKTANEVNTQDFVIERRSDDTEFAVIDVVPSKNVSGTHNYSFTDKNPLVGNSYYRLKQRDSDGKFTYSDISNVKIEGIALSLHPNPVGKELVVSHEYAKKPSVLKVLGLDGKIHIKTNTHIGASSSTINVASLASGTYLLVFEGEGKPKSQKFIKK